jgi:hypothetical protein
MPHASCHALQAQLEEESTLFEESVSSSLGHLKKKNTCFTGTKVQILTQKSLLAPAAAHTPAGPADPHAAPLYRQGALPAVAAQGAHADVC